MYKNQVFAVPVLGIDGSTLTTDYQVVNAGGLPNACFYLKVINTGDNEPVFISYDGTNDHDYIPESGSIIINAQTNTQLTSGTALFPIGFTVWARGSSANDGEVAVIGYYQVPGG